MGAHDHESVDVPPTKPYIILSMQPPTKSSTPPENHTQRLTSGEELDPLVANLGDCAQLYAKLEVQCMRSLANESES